MIDDVLWGLMMMVVGMGVVFALLLALMGVLLLIGRLDRPPAEELAELPVAAPVPAPKAVASEGADAAPSKPVVRMVADGLDENDVAAIAVAVMTHAENRRRQAGPETRAHAPGSQLFASRWLAVGRGFQNSNFTRK